MKKKGFGFGFYALCFFYLFPFNTSEAQFVKSKIDSIAVELQNELLVAKGLLKIDAYCKLMNYYKTQNPEIALEYGTVALEIAKGFNFKLGIAKIKKELGASHIILGNYNEAMLNLYSALDIAEELKQSALTADIYLEISTIYNIIGNLEKSNEYLKFAETLLFKQDNSNVKALINEKQGYIYFQTGEFDKALYYFSESLGLNIKVNNQIKIAKDYLNIGKTYIGLSTSKAKENFNYAYLQYNKINDKVGAATALFYLGSLQLKNEERITGILHLKEALLLANSIKTKQLQSEIYGCLSSVYEQEFDFKQSLFCFKQYVLLKDSILNDHKLEQIQDVTQKYNDIKKEKEVQQITLKNQTTISFFLIIISILVLFFALVFYRLYRARNRTNKYLKEKNIEIDKSKNDLIVLNRKFKKTAAKAKEADRLKTAFLANMSHEIRTPLNSIIGFTQLLSDDQLTEDQIQYIDIIHRSGKNLLVIINDIIDISKIEAGQLKLVKINCNINIILRELYEYFLSDLKNFENKQIELVLNLSLSELQSILYTDDVRLKQVLINLISNAIKFTHQGSVCFGCNLDEATNKMIFYVKDTGIGMELSKQSLVFQRFRQADGLITRKYGGTGLGLSISKGIVGILGGEIWLESQIGKGSTFYFSLPSENNFVNNFQTIKEQINESENYFWSDKTILIVEDDDNNVFYLKKILAFTQINIIQAKDGLEAVLKAKEIINLDILLMDIQLPEMNGWLATQQIRAFNKKIPIIAQTANAMDEDRIHCLESGFNEYITKPIDKNLFLKTLAKYLT